MPNRFEQVDEIAPDAINVILEQRADGQWARIICPQSAVPGAPGDRRSGAVAPKDALSAAVKLANQLQLAIVVIDPNGVWKKEWGALYRYAGEDQETP